MTEGLALFSQNNERRAYDDASSVGVGQAQWGKSGFLGVMQEEAKRNARQHREKGAAVKVSRWLHPYLTLLCLHPIIKNNKDGRQHDNMRICLTFLCSKVCSEMCWITPAPAQSDLEGSSLTRPTVNDVDRITR